MKPSSLLLSFLLLCGIASFSSAQVHEPDYERTYEKSFAIAAKKRIRIDHTFGPLTIDTWDQKEVKITARIEVRGDDAERYGEAVEIDVRPEAPDFAVKTIYPKLSGGKESWQNISFGVSMTLSIPREHAVEVVGSFGDVNMNGVVGNVNIKASNGDIRLRDVVGEITTHSSFGNVEAEGCSGRANIDSSNGRLRIRRHEGALMIDNSFGGVTIEQTEGDIELDCSNGKVEIERVGGSIRSKGSFGHQRYRDVSGKLRVDAGNSNVSAERVGSDVRIDTTFGDIRLQDVKGKGELSCGNGTVKIRRLSGSLVIEGSFGQVDVEESGPCEVNYTNGSVSLREVHGNAEIENTFGAVSVRDIEGSVHVRGQNANVKVRGTSFQKGRSFDCRTSFGSIELELPRPASAELDLSTSFGKIRSDFELGNIDRGHTHERCKATLGDGEMSATLHVTNGSIKLLRGKKRSSKNREKGDPN